MSESIYAISSLTSNNQPAHTTTLWCKIRLLCHMASVGSSVQLEVDGWTRILIAGCLGNFLCAATGPSPRLKDQDKPPPIRSTASSSTTKSFFIREGMDTSQNASLEDPRVQLFALPSSSETTTGDTILEASLAVRNQGVGIGFPLFHLFALYWEYFCREHQNRVWRSF